MILVLIHVPCKDSKNVLNTIYFGLKFEQMKGDFHDHLSEVGFESLSDGRQDHAVFQNVNLSMAGPLTRTT